ncbi:MAG TPA: hypothetical protein VKU00_13310 [Chthonomonadaceae bacterium]|nr:hypothetical protein [Chthonomonadaceae bacterium]
MEPLVGKSVAQAEEAQQEEERRALQKRRRVQLMLAGAGMIGVLVGLRLSLPHSHARPAPTDEARIEGDWELQSINGTPVGLKTASAIVEQKVHFQDGKLQGVTRVIADSEAGTTAMPFPDESVSEVKAGVLNNEVQILWKGTYLVLPNHLVEVHLGKATYRLTIKVDPDKGTLNMDQDTILTYRGPAAYHTTAPSLEAQTAQLP